MSHLGNKINFDSPRGMRDFYPEKMDDRNAIFNACIQASRQFGFSQYDACVVESLELLKQKSGEEIVKQIYAFQDKSKRYLALRPEITPSLARMVAARQGALTFPLKWFAIAQCFRYERMSRGRKREHYQWNLDIVGESALSAEAEIIGCAIRALSLLGLGPGDFLVHLSSRSLISSLLLKAGVPVSLHASAFRALDKREKLDDEQIRLMLRDSGLSKQHIDAVFRVVGIRSLGEASEMLGGNPPSIQEIQTLMKLLSDYGLEDRLCFDISIIRGLDYYTGIVFEAFDSERKFRAIFGGGRYDHLLEDVGGSAMPAVGLGLGDVVIAELLAHKAMRIGHCEKIDYAISYLENAQQPTAMQIACTLRGQGHNVDVALSCEKAKHFFAHAGKGKVTNAIFVGPDDIQRGTVRIKNLKNRTETETPLDRLL